MKIDIRKPKLTGKTEQEQIDQLASFIFQLCEQLQWAFDSIQNVEDPNNNQPKK